MRKTQRLKKLKKKIDLLRAKALELHKKSVDKDGVIDYEVFSLLNKTRTDIILTEKKISFLAQGKSYLGDSIGLETPRVVDYYT